MNPRTGLLVGLAIAACLVMAFTPAAHAQDGLQQLIEKQQAQNRQGPPPVGIILTVVSMVMLILVAALASALSQQTEANETKDGESDAAAPAPTPGPTPPPAGQEPQDGEGVSRVRCPRCAQVVVDFKGLRRDALSCPNCGDVLRPAP
jgi:uncharacterized C2H2 Zn-finger protein